MLYGATTESHEVSPNGWRTLLTFFFRPTARAEQVTRLRARREAPRQPKEN
jgi:hypothetical protein